MLFYKINSPFTLILEMKLPVYHLSYSAPDCYIRKFSSDYSICSLPFFNFLPFSLSKILNETMIEERLGLEHNYVHFQGIIDGIQYGYIYSE